MKNYQALEMPELVQEIEMLIDDWHFVKCRMMKQGLFIKNVKVARILNYVNACCNYLILNMECTKVTGI